MPDVTQYLRSGVQNGILEVVLTICRATRLIRPAHARGTSMAAARCSGTRTRGWRPKAAATVLLMLPLMLPLPLLRLRRSCWSACCPCCCIRIRCHCHSDGFVPLLVNRFCPKREGLSNRRARQGRVRRTGRGGSPRLSSTRPTRRCQSCPTDSQCRMSLCPAAASLP
jgi:hypothetical protein